MASFQIKSPLEMVGVRTSTCEFVEVGNIIQSITGNKDSQIFLLGHLPEVCEQAMIGLKDFTTSVRVEVCYNSLICKP